MSLEIIKHLNIDFYNSRYISINTKQYDSGSRFILITCYDQGKVFPIDNIYNHAYIRYRKPDDKNVFNCCDITENGEILVELTEQMLIFAGKSFADLIIVHNEPISPESIEVNNGTLLTNENTSILSTMLLCVNVIGSAIDGRDIESSDEYSAFNDSLIKMTEDYAYVMAACKISEDNALASETNAKASELKALVSETNAKSSELSALDSKTNAKISENNAKVSETNAKLSEYSASDFANTASAKADESLRSALSAVENAEIAANKAKESFDNTILAKSYAIGETNTRTNENIDNSKYYYTQTKAIKESLDGAFLAMGTVEFSQLQSVVKETGYVYHISNEFVTDDTFKQGAGIVYNAGTNVYYTADGYWDCFIGESTVVVDDGTGLIVTDDGDGNVTIECYSDYISTDEVIIRLQERIKALEDQTVLEIT